MGPPVASLYAYYIYIYTHIYVCTLFTYIYIYTDRCVCFYVVFFGGGGGGGGGGRGSEALLQKLPTAAGGCRHRALRYQATPREAGVAGSGATRAEA